MDYIAYNNLMQKNWEELTPDEKVQLLDFRLGSANLNQIADRNRQEEIASHQINRNDIKNGIKAIWDNKGTIGKALLKSAEKVDAIYNPITAGIPYIMRHWKDIKNATPQDALETADLAMIPASVAAPEIGIPYWGVRGAMQLSSENGLKKTGANAKEFIDNVQEYGSEPSYKFYKDPALYKTVGSALGDALDLTFVGAGVKKLPQTVWRAGKPTITTMKTAAALPGLKALPEYIEEATVVKKQGGPLNYLNYIK